MSEARAIVRWPNNAALSRDLRASLLGEIVEVVGARATELAPVGPTRGLSQSVKAGLLKDGEQGYVGARKPHAHLVHEGVRPHVVRIERRRAMRIASGAKAVFRKEVRHPGQRPQPFLTDALEQSRGEISRILSNREDLLEEAIE